MFQRGESTQALIRIGVVGRDQPLMGMAFHEHGRMRVMLRCKADGKELGREMVRAAAIGAAVGFWKMIPVGTGSRRSFRAPPVSLVQETGGLVALGNIENVADHEASGSRERQGPAVGVDDMRRCVRKHDALGIGVAQPHEGGGRIATFAPPQIGQRQRETDIVGIIAEAHDYRCHARDVVSRGQLRQRRLREGGRILGSHELGFDEGKIRCLVERRTNLAVKRFSRLCVPIDHRHHGLLKTAGDSGKDRLFRHRLPEPAEPDDEHVHPVRRHAFRQSMRRMAGEHVARHHLGLVEHLDAGRAALESGDPVGNQPVARAAPDRRRRILADTGDRRRDRGIGLLVGQHDDHRTGALHTGRGNEIGCARWPLDADQPPAGR